MYNETHQSGPSRYRIVGMTAQRHALPPSPAVAFGEGLLFGLPAGVLLAMPIALRLEGSWSNLFLVWLAAVGLHGSLVGLLAGALRVARPLPRLSPALALALLFSVGPFSWLGTMLDKNTHHRPLGAVTFAVLAAGIALLALALALRATVSIRSRQRTRRWLGWALLVGASLVSLSMAASPFLSTFMMLRQEPLYTSVVIDGLLGMALMLVGAFARFPRKLEISAATAGPLALGVCVLLFAVAMKSPLTGPALQRVSALWAWIA